MAPRRRADGRRKGLEQGQFEVEAAPKDDSTDWADYYRSTADLLVKRLEEHAEYGSKSDRSLADQLALVRYCIAREANPVRASSIAESIGPLPQSTLLGCPWRPREPALAYYDRAKAFVKSTLNQLEAEGEAESDRVQKLRWAYESLAVAQTDEPVKKRVQSRAATQGQTDQPEPTNRFVTPVRATRKAKAAQKQREKFGPDLDEITGIDSLFALDEDEDDQGDQEDATHWSTSEAALGTPATPIDSLKQPVFKPPDVRLDDLEPEVQTAGKGSDIRALLKTRKTPEKPKESQVPTESLITLDPTSGSTPAAKDPSPARNEETITSNKRKRTEGLAPWLNSASPNCFQPRHVSSVLCLHNEIVEFCKYIEERENEKSDRADVVSRIEGLAKDLWPEAVAHTFGSFANDLCIPTSDIDIVLFEVPANAIRVLAKALRDRQMVSEIEVIASARIPIIKLKLKNSPYQIDISFGIQGGVETGFMIRSLVREMPALRPLVLVIKFFLNQRDLNETYRGGIGSHLCLCLVVSMLQQFRKQRILAMSRKNDRVEELEDLGSLLLEFFDLYGRRFNYATVGISLRNGGSYIVKPAPDPTQHRGRPSLLYMENPEDPTQNLGGSSYNIPKVRKAFAHAHRVLLTRLKSFTRGSLDESILEAIIVANNDLVQRGPPSKRLKKE